MTHTDYTKSTVADLCFEADRVAILRCNTFDQDYTNKFIEAIRQFEGTPYDIKFELGIKALSCAELVWAGDTERRIGASLEDIVGCGQDYISPQGIYDAANLTVVIDTTDL
jgi:hypothetical protein